ncbi:MAG: YDG domain-containing protein, partial [Faecousia sp.]
TNVLSLTVVLGDPEGEPVGTMTITTKEPEKDTNGNYKISSAAELYWFANEVNENSQLNINAVLTKDITVNSNVLNANGELSSGEFETWTPIGKSPSYVYSGKFDGQGHTIYGLYVNDIQKWYVGLFGASAGTITNVKIADSYFNASSDVGGVCGINGGTVRNCVNSGTVIARKVVGGVCGTNITRDSYHGTITDCYNTGKVTGTYEYASVGGVCGSSEQSLITGCYNTGAVSGTGSTPNVGGVCGYNGTSTIKDCYNTGAVSSTNKTARVGGVCGYNNSSAAITGCYSTGKLSGANDITYIGGVCGCNNTESTVSNCYYNTDTYSGEPVGRNAVGNILCPVDDDVLGKTAREFASGEVAYLLNGGSPDGVWKQNIDVGTQDAAPNFTGGTVYTTASTSTCKGYSNTDNCTRDHNYAGGICRWCGEDTNLYITVSCITAESKTYDGNTTAKLNFDNVQLDGKEEGDDLYVTATGTFDSKDAGSRTVTITGLTLTGKDASKYHLANSGQQTTATATITRKDITVTITPGGGTYGGNITPATASLNGVLPGEIVPAVTLYYSGYAYDGVLHSGESHPTKAGTYTVEATKIGGIGSTNYTLTGTTTATFVINKATVTTPTVASKVYTGEQKTADISDTEWYTVTTNNGGTNVGSYPVVLSLKDANNYQWDNNGGTPTFQITQATNEWTVTPTITGWT